MDAITRVLELIRQGLLKIKWNSWCFTGGRDWGNWDIFDVFTPDGSECGYLELNDRNEFEINCSVDGETVWLKADDEDTFKRAESVVHEVIKRDDPEIIVMLSQGDEFLGFPRDYGGVSRENVLKGEWSW